MEDQSATDTGRAGNGTWTDSDWTLPSLGIVEHAADIALSRLCLSLSKLGQIRQMDTDDRSMSIISLLEAFITAKRYYTHTSTMKNKYFF